MKLLLILSLLCVNYLPAPPDTTKPRAVQKQKQKPASAKPVAKAKSAAPLFPSVLIVDLY